MPKASAEPAKASIADIDAIIGTAAFEEFTRKVIEHLVGRGLSRPWAQAMAEIDSRWIAGNMATKTVPEVSSEVFDTEVPAKLVDYRENVALFLQHYGIETGHTEAALDKHASMLAKAHKGKLPPWSVAAQMLHDIRDVSAYAVVAANDDSLSLELTDQVAGLMDKAVSLGLLGATREDVAQHFVRQGLLGLMRDGLVRADK